MPELQREETIPELTGPAGETRKRVGVLIGCVQQVFFSQVNAATVRVLTAEGCEVVAPKSQGCCGALSTHAGREEESFVPDRRMLGGSADAVVEELSAYAEQGVDHVLIQVSLLAPLVPGALEWVAAEVLPKLP